MRIFNYTKSVKIYLSQAKNREIAVWGNDLFSYEILQTIESLGYNVAYVVADENREFNIKTACVINPKEVSVLRMHDVFIFVAEITGHKDAYSCLTSMGFLYQRDFITLGIGGYTGLLNSIDSLLTLSRVNDKIAGFVTHGTWSPKAYKIVVLGNSTSDPTTGMLKSWPEYLQEQFALKNVPVCVINGAITGYSSTQEYLKLSRDVLELKPDMVISFSGFNDIRGNSTIDGFPYLHKYENKFYEFLKTHHRLAPDSMFVRNVHAITHGLPTTKQDYQIWIDNMRKMKAICKEFGVVFLAYLQPMLATSNSITTKEHDEIVQAYYKSTQSEKLIEDEKKFHEEVLKKIVDIDYIIDLGNVFSSRYNVFYDICHYTEYGNAIIAEAIYKNIFHYIIREKNEQ